jgi:hypothetical protein
MSKLRLSDDQRRIMAFFIDNTPDESLGLLAVTAYMKVISDYIAKTLKEDRLEWDNKDIDLLGKLARRLRDSSHVFAEDTRFWNTIQEQLQQFHPSLKARADLQT